MEVDLKKRIEDGEAIELMTHTEGWKVLKAHLEEQLNLYVTSNATEAKDWNNYLEIAGKIFGIRLLLLDVEDFIRMGAEAKEEVGQKLDA